MTSPSVAALVTLIWMGNLGIPGAERARVSLQCREGGPVPNLCQVACEDSQRCEFVEGVCRSCSGTGASPWIRFLKAVVSGQASREELGGDWGSGISSELLDGPGGKERFAFLGQGRWILAHSSTPWNFVTPWNDPKLRQGFLDLCESQTSDPWVFFELDEWGNPLRPRGVVCSPSS
jgi:hypothetical protein